MQYLTKLATGAAILLGTAGLTSLTANAATILVFGEAGTTSEFSALDTAGNTSISVTNGSIIVTGIDPASGLSFFAATLNLSGTSTDAATISAGNLVQNFSGTFSITAFGENILSGTFIDLLTGSGSGAVLTGTTPPDTSVTFTSDVIPVADLGVDRALSLSFSNVVPAIGSITAPSDGTYPSFSASVSGTFSANDTTTPPVPEPMSMALLGTGLFGLGLMRRRTRSSATIAL